jgi:DNA-binding response OmpR family regulator
MRLLLIEDDAKIASFITVGFRQEGFAVDHASDGREGLQFALNADYDAAIVDIMLPGDLDGLEVIEQLRQQGIRTPVLILSAKRSLGDRIKGIETGGDDYLVKPFAFSELLVRVQALIRRSMMRGERSSLSCGDLSIDLIRREVYRGGHKIDLQPREFALLVLLVRNAERTVTKAMILEHIWDFQFDPQTNVVDVLICRLRNKIEKGYGKKFIRTIRGIGYVFQDPAKNI